MERGIKLAHLHVTGWAIAIIFLFFVVHSYKKGNEKQAKVLHMLLRLEFLIILFSGIMLFLSYHQWSGELIIKIIAGLWAIVSMEMIAVKTKNKNATKAWIIQFVIAFIIAVTLGFGRLPLGVLP